MSVTKPDATVFDNADDSIATSRPELYTLATSFNTIADEYNAGTLGGGALLPDTDFESLSDNETTYNKTPTARAMSYVISGQTRTPTLNIQLETQSANTQLMFFVRNDMASNDVTVNYKIGSDTIGSNTISPSNGRIRTYILFDTGLSDSAGGTTIAVYSEDFNSSNLYTITPS